MPRNPSSLFPALLLISITITITGVLLSLAPGAKAQSSPTLALMPMPAHVQPGAGALLVDQSFGVEFEGYKEPRLERARERFLQRLSAETGIPLWRHSGQEQPKLIIRTGGASESIQKLGEDESYRLQATPQQIKLSARNPLGVLHGLQTVLQLVTITAQGFEIPAVTIDDQPRFPWRGLMIDSSRHFMPLDVVRRNLDGMEAVKMNVFHWHLSDDQGFRIESKKYPKLQEQGSDGLYYTQAEVRGVIEYARDRGIRVVPEFDMPGHATSWFVGYPDLSSGPGPYQIERRWGIFDPAMDPTRDSTYKFLDHFIGEMAALFPDAYFHVGGDEVNGKQWDASPAIQQFMQKHGLKSNQDLQAYFNTRVQKIVSKHKKIMEGWDEVLHPGIPKDVVIQSWRGQESLAEAARQGYRGLLSAGYYIDLIQSAAQHYAVDPMAKGAASLSAEEKQRILGGEATMWSEHVSPENIDSRIWPRTAAIAERLWSPPETTELSSMYARLDVVSRKLARYGLKQRSSYPEMLARMMPSGASGPRPLRVLGDVVEPVKGYERGELKPSDSFTPLNELIDAVPPESDMGRQFAAAADRVVNKTATEQDIAQMREWLMLWRDNDAQLEPLLQHSALLHGVQPLSRNLQSTAQAGLEALDYLGRGGGAPAAWRQQQLALLTDAAKPQAALLDTIVPSVQKLVQAAAPQ